PILPLWGLPAWLSTPLSRIPTSLGRLTRRGTSGRLDASLDRDAAHVDIVVDRLLTPPRASLLQVIQTRTPSWLPLRQLDVVVQVFVVPATPSGGPVYFDIGVHGSAGSPPGPLVDVSVVQIVIPGESGFRDIGIVPRFRLPGVSGVGTIAVKGFIIIEEIRRQIGHGH